MSIELDSQQDVAKREDEGVTIQLRDALGEPWLEQDQPITMTVAGTYSTRHRKAEAASGRRFQKQLRASPNDFDMRAYNQDIAAQCVIAWSAQFTDGGQPAPPTRENVLRVLVHMPWVQAQLTAAMEDHGAFFVKGSPS